MCSKSSQTREQFGHRLGQAGRLWRAEVDRRLSPHGLTESRWRLLLVLIRADHPLRQKELAEALCVQGPTLVRTLDWLEQEGLVERRSIAGDRRARTIHLTQQAAPSIERIQAVVESVRQDVFQGIDPEDVQTCLTVFDQIISNLGGSNSSKPVDKALTT
ncbi:MAG: MarR family transcriptional regulator [Natronospirillum sp.]